jgi:hypothetical protein
MTHSAQSKSQTSSKLKGFQKFVFINDSSMKLVPKLTKQLQLYPNSRLLHQAEPGDYIIIEQIHAPQNIIRQLQQLKFVPHKRGQLVSKTNDGSVIASLEHNLIGIGTEIARRIVVTVVGGVKP